jgi:hypothetical protein
MAAIGPPPKLGEFYDFFSFAHLTPPLHCKETHFSFSFSAVASRAECVWGIIN